MFLSVGKLDEKANQLHAIASLRVLLEAQKANGTVNMKMNKGVPNSISCPACSDCPDCTHGGHPSMVESPSGMHIVPTNVGGEMTDDGQMPPVENSPTSNVRVEEDKASNVQASANIHRVAEALDLSRAPVQKVMRNILCNYAYKLQLVQELLSHDFETRHLFSLQFLARLEVDPERPWNIL
ncbi:hypothetical protein TNCV_3582611 [Trichonephila clavipes]|nr:hypothetical protein TNCV_3582611 [Trichonephila clavipes]